MDSFITILFEQLSSCSFYNCMVLLKNGNTERHIVIWSHLLFFKLFDLFLATTYWLYCTILSNKFLWDILLATHLPFFIPYDRFRFTIWHDRHLKANSRHFLILKQKEASTNYLMQLVGSRREYRANWKHIRSIFCFLLIRSHFYLYLFFFKEGELDKWWSQ